MSGWNQPTNNNRDEWDDSTHTYRGYDRFNELVETRPYTPEEIVDANRAATKATLKQQGLTALVTNLQDIARNDIALAVAAPTQAQIVAQVKELTRQSTYHAQQLNALIRLVLDQMD